MGGCDEGVAGKGEWGFEGEGLEEWGLTSAEPFRDCDGEFMFVAAPGIVVQQIIDPYSDKVDVHSLIHRVPNTVRITEIEFTQVVLF